MVNPEKYFQLVKEFPKLFENRDEPGIIKIILDPERIIALESQKKEALRNEGLPEKWIDIGVLSEDQWHYVLRDMVEFPGGKTGGYLRVINRKTQEGGFGVVVMVKKAEKFLLLRHFRHDDRQWHWECPRGFGEPGLTARENAEKELFEEIGVEPKKMREIAIINNPKGEGGLAFFLAELHQDSMLALDAAEGIDRSMWVDEIRLKDMIVSGEVDDYYTMKAFLLLSLK